jgi:hypothetical protein
MKNIDHSKFFYAKNYFGLLDRLKQLFLGS